MNERFKTRTIFTVIKFEEEFLQVVRASVDENEIIRIPLHILSKEFIYKITYGLGNWESGVLFFAKIESIPGFTSKVYIVSDFEEDIEPVPTWKELLEENTK